MIKRICRKCGNAQILDKSFFISMQLKKRSRNRAYSDLYCKKCHHEYNYNNYEFYVKQVLND